MALYQLLLEDEKCIRSLSGNLKGRDHFEDPVLK
jgi:hypothetical protein